MSKKANSNTGWHVADGSYHRNHDAVKRLCTQHFGPEHNTGYNPVTKRKQDNHGNWKMSFAGTLHFRYKKDLTWFMLAVNQLADPKDNDVWGCLFSKKPNIL